MRVTIAPHPAHSSNFTPSGFFIFEYIKQKIVDQEFLSADDLLETIKEAFVHLSRSILESVFDE
jgi:hypothetical protein